MTRMRQSIDVDERVAMALWRYRSGDSARTNCLDVLELENPHVARFVLKLHRLHVRSLVNNFWELPLTKTSSNKLSSLKLGVYIGAERAPTFQFGGSFARRKILWCFKGFYSLVLQIVAGADYWILADTMGHAGNTHDSTIMENHSFWTNRRVDWMTESTLSPSQVTKSVVFVISTKMSLLDSAI